MKRLAGLSILLFLVLKVSAQNMTTCPEWKISEVNQLQLPFFAEKNSVDGKKYDLSVLLENVQPDISGIKGWPLFSLGPDSLISLINAKDQLVQMAGFVRCDRWAKAIMKISTNAVFELYLDGKKVKTNAKVSLEPVEAELTLGTGVHGILLKMISTAGSMKFTASISAKNDSARVSWTTNPRRTLTINDVLDGKSITEAKLSPSGKFLLVQIVEILTGTGKSQRSFTVFDIEGKRNLFSLHNNAFRADWLPSTDRLAYQVERDDKTDIWLYDIKTGNESLAASGLKSPQRIRWSPKEDFFIYSCNEEADKVGNLKRVFGNEDRIPGSRDRSYLYLYSLTTKLAQPLTAGVESAVLHDIRSDGTRLLFSTSRADYSEVPFTKQNLYELELSTMSLDTIWKDKLHGGSCQYSPDGRQMLVSGGPETFGETGVKVSKGRIPNSYDTQLFLFDLGTGKTEALTLNFDPSIARARWTRDGKIYLTADERDYVNLYRMDIKKRIFEKINLPVEVVSAFDIASNKTMAVYSGSSISTPERLYMLDLSSGKSTLLIDPKSEQLEDVEFGKSEEWNFVNSKGTTIYGRVYYPVGYDPQKVYPVIVNYYGGTSPTNRAFGGRYPKNIWAGEGYMVYVLQPSGSTGFGQDFSALHVNGWGLDAIDDIIEGTKKFLEAFPSADTKNVGCIGASYGGYTTMMLQTRVDIFKTAISHAGISDITSYWGEGYWGYSYSSGATRNSYPWNRKDIYVDNSPVFNADKFHNSILLLHGTCDTNVPVGESLQFYAALKILGKEVEMVLVEGENHHILDYKKRLEWHDTIMAWFDKKLKNQSQHWDNMYPVKNM